MRVAWCTHDTRMYGVATIAFVRDDGNSSATTMVRLPDAAIVQSATTITRGYDTFPIGLETAPQLALKVRNIEAVRNEIIMPLLAGETIVVIMHAPSPTSYTLPRNRPSAPLTSGVLLFVGVISTDIEFDVIKDDETKVIVDDLGHYAASQVTASDLYAAIIDLPSFYRVTDNDSWYDLHPEADVTIGTLGGTPIKGIRFFDPFNATSVDGLFTAMGNVISSKAASILASVGFVVTNSTTVILQPIVLAGVRRIGTTTYPYSDPDIYILTDYRSSDTNKQRWGYCAQVARARSVRDAIKEFAESLCIRMWIQHPLDAISYANRTITYKTVLMRSALIRYGSGLPVHVLTSRKLFYNVVSTVTVTCAAWHSPNVRDYAKEKSKRYNDYGVRLGAHNVPLDVEKWYARQEGSVLVLRPDSSYDRSAIAGVYVRDGSTWVRPFLLRSYYAHGDSTLIGSTYTHDGRTFGWSLPSLPVWGYDHRHYIADAILDLFGRPSQQLVEAVITSPQLGGSVGYHYEGIGIVISEEVSVQKSTTTVRALSYAD